MPYAKEILRIVDIIVAMPGNFVAQSAVEHYGWHDKVTDEQPATDDEPKRRGRRKAG